MGAENGFDPKKNDNARIREQRRSCLIAVAKLLLVLSPIPLFVSICFGGGPFIATLMILAAILLFLFLLTGDMT